ncbi:MAG TPA: hypothetical protein VFZ21_18350, partial [Gemmatimonadaceae bacterium]|nr:hypothetical protein [Gemmatimonadaceae bacterium]
INPRKRPSHRVLPHSTSPVPPACRTPAARSRQRRSGLGWTRRSGAFLALSLTTLACQGVPPALGPDRPSARANADALFDGLARRFDRVQRAPKFQEGRGKLGRYALSPSRLIGDTSIWTTSSPADSTRVLSLLGTHTPTGYRFTPQPTVPIPAATGDSRHVIRLRRRGESTYEWQTFVDHAIGSIRARDVAAATTAWLAAPERLHCCAVRVPNDVLFPRTTRVLGELFSLDSVRATPMQDGSSSVVVRFRMHPDLLAKTRPNFAKYLEKYVTPARFHAAIRDGQGNTWFDATGGENSFSVAYRSRDGRLLALTDPARPLPDSAQLAIDFSAKFMIFRVGVENLVGDFVSVRSENERGWSMRFRREPEWHFPLAVNHLIRTSLRHPFTGDGIGFRVTVRDSPGGQSMLSRQSNVSVQESAIVRWLGGLGGSAMSDFAGRAEAEENRYLYEVLSALRADFVAALGGGE